MTIATHSPLRLAVLRDFRQEHWPSMDLVADRLLMELRRDYADRFAVEDLCPAFSRSLSRLPLLGKRSAAANFERLWNRQWRYVRFARRIARNRSRPFDFFHIADHSYAQLVHGLPADRTGVFCHDLDAFRCLLSPLSEPRPAWFRAMARRTLHGLQKAAVVFYTTEGVRDQILRHGLIDTRRLVKTPLGVAEEFAPAQSPAASPGQRPFLLHVGSCIARKRIDVLLEVFARLRKEVPELQLQQVGGQWTPRQLQQIERLKLAPHVIQKRGIPNDELARLYQSARLVLQTSEAEGFGLPVAEALACGSIVIASDIPVLREVAGSAAVYCRMGDVPQWTQQAAAILQGEQPAPPLSERIAQAGRYTWREYAKTIAGAYERLAQPSANTPAAGHAIHLSAAAFPEGA